MLRRKSFPFYYVVDDQSYELVHAYNGSWIHVDHLNANESFIDDTYSLTYTPGSTFRFSFDGSMAMVYGGVARGSTVTYPQAMLSIDGSFAEPMSPYLDGNQIVYIKIQDLTSSSHTIFVNITAASKTSPFTVDALLIVPPGSGEMSTVLLSNRAAASTSKSHLGPILGGTLGGCAALMVLAYVIIFFIRRRARLSYSNKRPPGGVSDPESRAPPEPSSPPPLPNRLSNQQFAASLSYRNSEIYSSPVGANPRFIFPPIETEDTSSSSDE